MDSENKCPKCASENTYQDMYLWVCPECFYEWDPSKSDELKVVDANGNTLSDGDSVALIKDLKVKGSSSAIKVGTKVKNIRLADSDDGHNISCKVDGFGDMFLKSEFVKKL